MASSFRGTGLAQRAALGLTQVRFLSRVQQIKPEVKKLKRLAVPAKAKRVLSAVDSLFAPQNVHQDELMLQLLAENRGWMTIKGLQKFPQIRGWSTAEVFDVAFAPSVKRYETRARSNHINGQLQLSHVRSKRFGKAFKKSTRRIRSDLLQDGWEDTATEDELATLLNTLQQKIKHIPRAGPPLPPMDTIRGPPERRKLIHSIRNLFSQQHHSRVNPFMVLAVRLAASELLSEFEEFSIEREQRKTHRDIETARFIPSQSLPRFKIPDEMRILVAMSYQGVERVCQEIVDDLDYCNDAVPFLGIDVEYATLEQDLRQLPAMLQLASRNVVGLIWLDKLPKHGRELGSWENSKLLGILEDRDIYKVGVGARHDCLSISEWWGKVPINGITDFNLLPPEWIAKLLGSRMHQGKGEASQNKMTQAQKADDLQISELRLSLANWCEVLLGKELVKKKIQGKKKNRHKATSHWRTANLSTQMQIYAAEDAVVSQKLFEPLMSVISKRDLDEFVSSHSI